MFIPASPSVSLFILVHFISHLPHLSVFLFIIYKIYINIFMIAIDRIPWWRHEPCTAADRMKRFSEFVFYIFVWVTTSYLVLNAIFFRFPLFPPFSLFLCLSPSLHAFVTPFRAVRLDCSLFCFSLCFILFLFFWFSLLPTHKLYFQTLTQTRVHSRAATNSSYLFISNEHFLNRENTSYQQNPTTRFCVMLYFYTALYSTLYNTSISVYLICRSDRLQKFECLGVHPGGVCE